MYTQNDEEIFISNYFKNELPSSLTVLDIGANDGEMISNSRKIILDGWNGILLEPSLKAFNKILKLYEGNTKVKVFNFGISNNSGRLKFFESGSLGFNDRDVALYSSILEKETKRWDGRVEYEETEANFLTFDEFIQSENLDNSTIDFITIDAEGMDLDILRQINLRRFNCRLLCIEWNSLDSVADQIVDYCKEFDLYEITRNPENIILGRI